MAAPLVAFPDVEAALTGYLRGELDPGVHVGTEWPENLLDSLPVVSLSRGGGATYLRYVLDEPTVDVDVLAADKAAAHDLAQLVRAHVAAVEGQIVGGAHITRVDDVSFVWVPWLPASGTDPVPRYVLSLSMRVRPA